MMSNRYVGKCHACGKTVEPGAGKLEYIGGYHDGKRVKYLLWCMACFNASDCSGEEDRCCGNRAYEDQCARMSDCGPEYYGY